MSDKIKGEMREEEWYEVRFFVSHRQAGNEIHSFLNGAPLIDDGIDSTTEVWLENTEVLRDSDGNFYGIKIIHNNETAELVEFICKKTKVSYQCLSNRRYKLNIKLVR